MRDMNPEQNTMDNGAGTDSSIGLFLALYLILLGFFIVLTAVSEPAVDRTENALASVNGTFKKIATDKKGEKDQNLDFPKSSDDPFLKSINDRLFSALSVKGRFGTYKGNVLEVDLSVDNFFQRGSLSINSNKTSLLADILAPVKEKSQGNKEVFILFGVGTDKMAKTEQRSDQLATMRAGAMTDTMTALGFSAKDYSVGLIQATEGTMKLVFRHKKAPLRFGKMNSLSSPNTADKAVQSD